ncbi:MAG: translation initiation factor IF-3 [Candidatus Marinimicrobia bacterium]|nr:translation initiation factor IF-3 [Candidatus Neomarinimicrobiota bacterium]MCF7828269.1 translation initiation factor IF-3 [Candidatus Neomarinimicrobiota bacterium]MCF7879556.1 translation initiation factor IF-3 [Candidatus Neomarinimicrobiota bacterium]
MKDELRVNEDIRVHKVRLIDNEGEQLGIVDIKEARNLGEERGYDLVEVAPNADPPVVRLLDYGKYLYEQKKKEKEAKKKQHTIEVKEVRFRPQIEEHDFQTKLNHMRKFLENGNKVKVTVFFRGREMEYQEFGRELMDRVVEETEDVAKVDGKPNMEGRTMVMYLMGDPNN